MKRLFVLWPALLLLAACTLPASPGTQPLPPPTEPETVFIPRAPVTETGGTLEERALSSGMPSIGHRDAPVTFTLYTHHSCDYCKTFDRTLTDRLLTTFVENGLVRIVVVLVPLQAYPESGRQAALLACATAQGKGWAMHRALFDGEPSTDILAAGEIDTDALAACLDATDVDSIPPASAVSLVPSYAINDQMYTGLPAWPELRGQINAAL